MARKDVSLVIKARNEASAALDKINASLEEFRVAQTSVAKDSSKTSEALKSLSGALDKVETALGGMNAASLAADRLRQATQGLQNLQAESAQTATALSATRKELRETKRSLAGYESTLANLNAKLELTKQKQKEAAQAQKIATSEAKKSQSALDGLIARRARLPELLAKESAALDKAAGRWRNLKAKIDAGGAPASSFKAFESASNNVARLAGNVKKLEAEFAGIGGQIKNASDGVRKFGKATKDAEREAAKQAESLAKIGKKHDELRTKIAQANTAIRGLASAASQSQKGLAGLAVNIDNAKESMVELEGFTKDAGAALSQLRAEGGQKLEQQLVEQGLAAQRAKQEFREFRDQAAALGAEIARVGVPTRKMSEEFHLLKASANEAELKLMAQEEALQRMGRAYAESTGDIDKFRSGIKRFQAAQGQLSGDLRELANDGLRTRNEIRKLHVDAAGPGLRRLANDADRASGALRGTRRSVSTLRQAYNDLYGGSRQSLSITQRLRGEVLSLIAAYGGFYGVIRVLGGVINAYKEIEGAQARLNVANAGDFRQTASDLDYLRRSAERLGVNFGLLSREYSKFKIAAQNTNLQGARARKIFEAVTEAARVSRSSTEELQGVFTALVQIVSKGAVQMEELRQQLGDRLPGAIQIMADGLGVGTAEMIKMMEQGQVTADALVGFADKLGERFGQGLDESLSSTSAELGRLENAAFQALLAFGKAGFIESFNDLLRDLQDLLNGADFRTFAERMAVAFGGLLDAVGLVAKNFQLFSTIIGAAIGLKSIRLVEALIGSFKKMNAAVAANALVFQRWQRVQTASNAQAAASIAVYGRVARSIRTVSAAMKAMIGSTGLGLFLVAAGALFGRWLTSASDVNTVMETHVEIMDKVKNAYDEAEGNVLKWRKALKDLTADQLQVQLQKATSVFNDEVDKVQAKLRNFEFFETSADNPFFEAAKEVRTLSKEFGNSEISAEKLREKILAIREAIKKTGNVSDEELARVFASLFDSLDSAKGAEQSVNEVKAALVALTGGLEEAQDALNTLGTSAGKVGRDLEPIRSGADDAAAALEAFAEKADRVKDAIRGILSQSPTFKDYFDEIEKQEALGEMYDDAIAASLGILELKKSWDDISSAVSNFFELNYKRVPVMWDSFEDGVWQADTALVAFLTHSKTGMDDLIASVSELTGKFETLAGVLSDAVGGVGGFFNTVMGNFEPGNASRLEETVNRIIYRESAGRPDARAQDNAPPGVKATATGLGQFTEDTWLRYFRKFFPNEAARMTDAAMLQLRLDPQLNYRMTTLAVESYAVALSKAGAPVNDTSLYLSHFLGESEAIRLLKTSGTTPFAQFSPSAARSNPTFANMSVQEVIGYFATALRNVTPEQLARVQQFNPNVVGETKPYEKPEFAERLDSQREFLDDQEFQIKQQERINAGLERESIIEAAIRDARKSNPYAGEEFYKRAGAAAATLFDMEEKRRKSEEAAAQQDATNQTLSDAEFAVRQQTLVNQGLERQAAIEEAIRAARAADPNISQQQIDLLVQRTGALHDLQVAQSGETEELKRAEKAQERVNLLLAERSALEEKLQLLLDRGDTSGANLAAERIKELNKEIVVATESAKAMWAAVGTGEATVAIAQLENARIEAQGLAEQGFWTQINWTGVADLFAGGLTDAFMTWTQAVANGENSVDAAKRAFLQFASDFLLQIARMIIQQAILNALSAAFGGTGFGALIGVPTGHSGGEVGSSGVGSGRNLSRQVHPAVFVNAPRYHSGGQIGLRPGEVPIIAKIGEEMVTEDDPRHSRNGGGMGSAAPIVRVNNVNVIDPTEVLQAALSTQIGTRTMLNFMSVNQDKLSRN